MWGDSNEYPQHRFLWTEAILMSTHNVCFYGTKAILMSTHNICSYGEITKIIPKLSSNTLLICSTDYPLIVINYPPYEPPHDKTNRLTVRPAKTQISLGIRPDWSESSLCAQWVAKDSSFLHADCGDFHQTGRMLRLIWVFAGRTIILLVLSRGGSYLFLWLFISTLWVQRYPYIVGRARRIQQSELPLTILCRMVHHWTTII